MEVGVGLLDFVRETGFGGCPLTGSSEGSVGSGEGSGGVATTLGTGLLVIAHAVLLHLVIVHTVLLAVLVAAYLFSHVAGVLSGV